MAKALIAYEDFLVKFKEMIKSMGLNNSIHREYVLKILFDNESHLNTEQIHQQIKQQYKVNIGIATVYRVISLLEELKVVSSISIEGQDSKVYELNITTHHDHMICQKCNKIVEFFDDTLEKIQEQIAKEHNFALKSHNMIIYGICKECQPKDNHE
jgi:Fur family ferric uptake transcriptional regulator